MALNSEAAEIITRRREEILDLWEAKLRETVSATGWAGPPEGRLRGYFGELLDVFVEFLRSPETVETFSREGRTRALVERVARHQGELGRDAVQVVSDYMLLRRAVWEVVGRELELGGRSGEEVARFFGKTMAAMDWAIGAGAEAFNAIQLAAFEDELGQARATDLITGLPDRDSLNRKLLPRAMREHRRLSLAVFDLDRFSETVALAGVGQARAALVLLAETVRKSAPEGALCARFGDDEICVILPGMDSEQAYGVAEEVLENIASLPEREKPWELNVHAGIAEYPVHGRDVNQLLYEVTRAMRLAKRVGGSGIMIAR
ncbi:diguanylate cyclase [Rubrobacter taiwanensis]|jgi:diguanylate cyclase (GGDEF)-like protein|uniref:Diguanylate cyclase n=1 Tax=Rubrobacter taiwanensis TaxID=185139 RepID=A0A4V2NWC1_9ACTN|nr:diguanylate cyclase [Rubrobacter taiwanensis]TCJ16802.1 diguanylate cyclase [Rubrobacter taiwanensis]